MYHHLLKIRKIKNKKNIENKNTKIKRVTNIYINNHIIKNIQHINNNNIDSIVDQEVDSLEDKRVDNMDIIIMKNFVKEAIEKIIKIIMAIIKMKQIGDRKNIFKMILIIEGTLRIKIIKVLIEILTKINIIIKREKLIMIRTIINI